MVVARRCPRACHRQQEAFVNRSSAPNKHQHEKQNDRPGSRRVDGGTYPTTCTLPNLPEARTARERKRERETEKRVLQVLAHVHICTSEAARLWNPCFYIKLPPEILFLRCAFKYSGPSNKTNKSVGDWPQGQIEASERMCSTVRCGFVSTSKPAHAQVPQPSKRGITAIASLDSHGSLRGLHDRSWPYITASTAFSKQAWTLAG